MDCMYKAECLVFFNLKKIIFNFNILESELLNTLRQSRAATETVLPGNDPNTGQQQQQQQQQPSEECRMFPSLPGC